MPSSPVQAVTLLSRHVLHCQLNVFSSLALTIAIFLLGTNPHSVHSQFRPMIYPGNGAGNSQIPGRKQLALYPGTMNSRPFGNTGFGVPGMPGNMGYNPLQSRLPQSMIGAYPLSMNNNLMARSLPSSMFGPFGSYPQMMPGGAGGMQPPMMGGNSFGQPSRSFGGNGFQSTTGRPSNGGGGSSSGFGQFVPPRGTGGAFSQFGGGNQQGPPSSGMGTTSRYF